MVIQRSTTGDITLQTTLTMFVRREGKRGHEKVKILVEWDGTTSYDIQLLANHYVMHRVEHALKGWDEKLPDTVEVDARDYVHNEPLAQEPLEFPESWKAPPASKLVKDAKAAFKNLTAEEQAILLGEFT